mgnify:FL=1
MKMLAIVIIGLLLSNCSNSYVKNKKRINSPNDLMKFTNIWCNKNKSTEKIIKMCGQGWSKDLNISENKAILDAKLKIADINQHTIVSSEEITHKENSKGIVSKYQMKANNVLEEATISGYRILDKKVLKDKNGWRTMILIEYKLG